MAGSVLLPYSHIAVEGPIGVGKTSLVKLLAQRFSSVAVLEDVDNPFLADFYKGKPGAEFQVQLYFLLSRFQQLRELSQRDLFKRTVISDYMFQKDRIFAYLNLSSSDLAIYERLYRELEPEVPSPELVIYMQASVPVLMERIRKRGRPFESDITEEYLERVCEAYSYFFFHWKETPLLVVNTDEIDFVANESDLDRLVEQIVSPQTGNRVFVPLGSNGTGTAGEDGGFP